MGNPPYGWPAIYPSVQSEFGSDTSRVVYQGPCRLMGVSGKLNGQGASLRFKFYDLGDHDGVTATASADLLRAAFGQITGAALELQGIPFENGIVLDVSGSSTLFWCTTSWIPDKTLGD